MRFTRAVTAVGAAGAAGAALWAAKDLPTAFGGVPDPVEMSRSPRFSGGTFHNPEGVRESPAPESGPGRPALREFLFGGQRRRPKRPIPLVREVHGGPAAEGVAVTWFGHASALLEIEGHRVLLDPVWSARCSPSQAVGPRRLHEPPVPLEALPSLDAVVISHDHYDHLDMATVRRLAALRDTVFAVPLGVGAHLARWGVPAERVTELDWGESLRVGGVDLIATAAHHFSGRRGPNGNQTLWGSWVVAGRSHRAFYSGDSGYFNGYATIGAEYGPFDLSLVQVGAYSPYWPDIHMTPEEGVTAHRDLRGGLLVPVHWATFVLAMHDWAEPVERVLAEAAAHGVEVAVPRPGERLDTAEPPKPDHWWRGLG